MSMTRQLWAAILVSMLLALAGSLVASLLNARTYLVEQLAQKNVDNATSLALSLTQGELDDVRVELAVAALFDSGHYRLVRVEDPKGRAIVERVAKAREPGAPAWFVAMLPIRAEPGTAQVAQGWRQYGRVILESESRFAYETLWDGALQMCVALALAGLVAGYLGSLILRRLIPPLRAVVEQAAGITQRRFATIAPPKVPELAQLAEAMNAMVERVKAMFDLEAARLDEMRRQANDDPLTQLANRSYFMGRLAQVLSVESSGGVLALLRVARLAEVNQRLGREATDELLRRVARCAEAAASGSADALAGRLGGADFAVLWPGHADAAAAAQALVERVVAEAPSYGLDPRHFAFAGAVALHPGAPVSETLARADAALASAEAGGESRATVASDAPDPAHPRSAEEWTRVLKGAVANRWLKLQPFPVVEFVRDTVHWECALRLRFDEGGDWQPAGQFLPVAERLHMTAEIDLAAVRLGLEALEGPLAGSDVALNLSPQSVADPAFRTELAALLGRHRALAARLWLEVAESGALLHLDAMTALCRDLVPLGCRIGIEHFGREFGQIARLHHLGLSYLKVDASYTREVASSEGNRAFLAGLRSIASAIGVKLYAEGVAASEEIATLAAIGFDGVTGPGVRRP